MKVRLKVVIVEPGRPAYVSEIKEGLEPLQELVGGYIEAVESSINNVDIVVNECGKIDGLPANRVRRDESGQIIDVFHGSFCLIGVNSEGAFISLTAEQIEHFMNEYQNYESIIILATESGHRVYASEIKESEYLYTSICSYKKLHGSVYVRDLSECVIERLVAFLRRRHEQGCEELSDDTISNLEGESINTVLDHLDYVKSIS